MSKFNVVVPADDELPEHLQGKGYVGIQHAERPYHNLLTTKEALMGLAEAEDLKEYLDAYDTATVGSMFGCPEGCTVAVIPTSLTQISGEQQALLVYYDDDETFAIAVGQVGDILPDDDVEALRANPQELAELFGQIRAL